MTREKLVVVLVMLVVVEGAQNNVTELVKGQGGASARVMMMLSKIKPRGSMRVDKGRVSNHL